MSSPNSKYCINKSLKIFQKYINTVGSYDDTNRDMNDSCDDVVSNTFGTLMVLYVGDGDDEKYNQMGCHGDDFITPDVQDTDTKKITWWQKLLSLIKWRRQKK